MSGYKPSFNITNEKLAYVSSISEKIGKISATSNLETKPHLRRNNRIKSIHSSLKIEAIARCYGIRCAIHSNCYYGDVRIKVKRNISEKLYEAGIGT